MKPLRLPNDPKTSKDSVQEIARDSTKASQGLQALYLTAMFALPAQRKMCKKTQHVIKCNFKMTVVSLELFDVFLIVLSGPCRGSQAEPFQLLLSNVHWSKLVK